MRRGAFLGAVSVALLVVGTRVPARDLPEGLPRLPFHLTARPWEPLDVTGVRSTSMPSRESAGSPSVIRTSVER